MKNNSPRLLLKSRRRGQGLLIADADRGIIEVITSYYNPIDKLIGIYYNYKRMLRVSIIKDCVKSKILDSIRKLNGDKSRRYYRMQKTLISRKFSFDELTQIAGCLADELKGDKTLCQKEN